MSLLKFFAKVPAESSGSPPPAEPSSGIVHAGKRRRDDAGDEVAPVPVKKAELQIALGADGDAAAAHAGSTGGAAAASSAPAASHLFADVIGPVHDSWHVMLATETRKPYFSKLMAHVASARSRGAVFPPADSVFNVLRLTPLSSVRVVILGQDPYHGAGQAHGLSFSVRPGVPLPPSLLNILKEVASDTGVPLDRGGAPYGCLDHWAQQGVLLLNAVLTVEAGKPNSHAGQGWEDFTSAVIAAVARQREGMVFLLWGKPAQAKAALIRSHSGGGKKHVIMEAAHPSPLAAHKGFFGCKHFSKTNAHLRSRGLADIDWGLKPSTTPRLPSAAGVPLTHSAIDG